MELFMSAIFAIGLSLLLVHEMDAIRRQEWRLFAFLRPLEEQVAFRMFLLAHLPLYCILLFLLISPYAIVAFVVVDVFLVAHALLHVLFRKHKENRFDRLSYSLIFLGGLCGLAHLVYLSTPYFFQ